MANYIGKIAAVVTANVSDVAPKLSAGAREWNKYGKSVQASIDAARRNARSSFDQIFTAQQRLERAFAASRNTTLKIDTREGEDAIRRLIGASEELARPLVGAQKQFSSLSASIQGEFGRALSEAQNAARTAGAAITETGRLGEQSFERYKRRVDEAVVSIRRLVEADSAVGGLATGRELRFQQAGFSAELQRTSALQSQASALPADARASGALGQLVELQRREAEEAARLLAVLENVRNTRRGDAAAAQANLDAQVRRLAEVNAQLERQVRLSNAASQATSVRGLASAAERRAGGGGFSSLGDAERGAADLFRRIETLGPQAFRQLQGEIDGLATAFETGFVGPVNVDFQRLLQSVEQLEEKTARLRDVSRGFLTIITPEEAAADTPAAVDQQRRREVATALLPPVIDLPPDPRQASLERTQALADRLGPDIASSATALAQLESSTVSLKNQISQLPAPFRAQLIPAIRQAENELLRLTAADDALPEDIERAAASLRQLEQGYRRATSAASLLSSEDAIERVATRESAGQLDAAARVLAQVGAQAGGPVAQAYDRLRAAQQRFIAEGTSGTPAARREIEQLQRAVAQAAAETGRISFSRAFREIQRGGDVARGTFSNIGLGVQQVAFIFDDFFAVTGDISQRIRAIGNNVSQLGFVLGGTTGLVVGVAASLIAQGVAGLIRFANSSVEAQDRANAFNESLARQKTIVEELAQAYDGLARSSLDGVFSGFNGVGFERSIRDIRRQQAELAREVAASADPTVRRERAVQSARERELQQESDFGRRIALQAQIESSRARERVASDAASRRLVTPQDATEAVVRRLERLSAALADDSLIGGFSAAVEAQNRARQFAQGRGAPTDAASTAAFLRAEIERLTPAAGRSFIGSIPFRGETVEARRAIEEFQTLLAPLDASRLTEISRQNVELIRQAQSAGRALATAQQEAAAAIEAGIPSASRLSFLIDFLGEELEDATNKFNTASEELLAAERQPAGARRDADIARAEERRRIAAQNVNALRGQREQINESIDQLRLLRLTNPSDFASERIRRAEENISSAGLGLSESVVSQRIRQIEARQQSLTAREQQIRSGGLEGRELQNAIADIVRQRAALNEQAIVVQGATRALRSFTDALSRSQQAVESNVQASRQRLDQAREQELALPSATNIREREIAERALREQEQSARAAREVFDIERERIAQRSLDPASDLFETFQEIARIENQLSARGGDQADRERLIARRAELEGVVARAVRLSPEVRAAEDESSTLRIADALAADGRRLARTPAEAAAIELADSINRINAEFNRRQKALIDEVANAALIEQPVPDDEVNRRSAEIELDRRAAQRRTIEGAAVLGLTEAQRFRRTIDEQIGELGASAGELVRGGDAAGARQLIVQGQTNLARQNAPLFAQFADEVRNAVLQGPSRAALQVSDASTSEGQRELNRLLRGEDPARDVNLNELQKQSGFLQIIADAASKALQQVGIAQ